MSRSFEGVALIVGAGEGLGAGLARQFSSAGMEVAIASRDSGHAEHVATGVARVTGRRIRSYACDATREADVAGLFAAVTGELGAPSLVVYNASGFLRRSILDIEAEELTRQWQVTCLGAFIVGRAAAVAMVERGNGTLIFTGATACYKGSAHFAGFAVGKFGLRALAQSMARELGPAGVHVALVNIDGQINGPQHAHEIPERGIDTLLDPDAIASTYLDLHGQHPTAWSHEIDLRPAVERW